ncbi:hypothetical protein [Faecalicatena orotica]|jgi:hypothetical protein|uniref:hypothetical protein n=1 Tax=Faecalicatena orotica TaxID=1544 RepID=UPI003216BC0C
MDRMVNIFPPEIPLSLRHGYRRGFFFIEIIVKKSYRNIKCIGKHKSRKSKYIFKNKN